MGVVTELGMSDQEVHDALNLEKLYSLMKKTHASCTICGRSPTHVDCSSQKFLCDAHAVGRGSCKQIGSDRFNALEIQKLQKKYGSHSNISMSRSPVSIGSSSRRSKSAHSSRRRSSSRSTRRRKHSPSSCSTDSCDSLNDLEGGFDFPASRPDRPSSNRYRSSSTNKQHQSSLQPTFVASFDEPLHSEESHPEKQTQYPAGMAGYLMQKQSLQNSNQYPPSQYNSSSFNPTTSDRYSQALKYSPTTVGHSYDTYPLARPPMEQRTFPMDYAMYSSTSNMMNHGGMPPHTYHDQSHHRGSPYGQMSSMPMMYPSAPYMENAQLQTSSNPHHAPNIFQQSQWHGSMPPAQQQHSTYNTQKSMNQFYSTGNQIIPKSSQNPQMFSSLRSATTNPFDVGPMQPQGYTPHNIPRQQPFTHPMQSDSKHFDYTISDPQTCTLMSNQFDPFSTKSAVFHPSNSMDMARESFSSDTHRHAWMRPSSISNDWQRLQSVPSNMSHRIPNETSNQKDWWD